MPVTQNEIIVRRGWEDTLAIVKWKGVSENEILDRVRSAVTNWVNTTDEGKKAWLNSSQDFNVGDLWNHLGNEQLIDLLKTHDVHELEIHIMHVDCNDHNWKFDTLLVKE